MKLLKKIVSKKNIKIAYNKKKQNIKSSVLRSHKDVNSL